MAVYVSPYPELTHSSFFLGPTVNDALANLGHTATEEVTQRYGHAGFEYMHEYEADLVALR